MDLSPLIILVLIVVLVAFSMKSRMRNDRDGRPGSDLRPPGEPGNLGRDGTNLDL